MECQEAGTNKVPEGRAGTGGAQMRCKSGWAGAGSKSASAPTTPAVPFHPPRSPRCWVPQGTWLLSLSAKRHPSQRSGESGDPIWSRVPCFVLHAPHRTSFVPSFLPDPQLLTP